MSGCEQTSEFGQHEYRTGSGNERVVLRFLKPNVGTPRYRYRFCTRVGMMVQLIAPDVK
jgi:hypothetical protein